MIPEPFLSWFHALFLLLRENDEKALFLLLLVEEAGVPLPLPGDTVIMFAGYQASMGKIGLLEAAVAVTLAVQMGSAILYMLSRRLGHTLLFKYGKFIHLDQSKLDKVERWIHQRGPIMVLVGRLTPGLRTPTSIIAGVFEVPYHQFLFYTTLAAVSWSGLWLLLGFFFGRQLIPLARYLHSPTVVALTLALLLGAGLALYAWWRRRNGNLRARRLPEVLPASSPEQPS